MSVIDVSSEGIYSRDTSADAQYSTDILFLRTATSGASVLSVEDALRFSAFWAAVKVITETVACLPWSVRLSDGETYTNQDRSTLWRLLNVRPNEEASAFSWRETMVFHALTWGNAYSEIGVDNAGRVSALWPIEPHRVEQVRLENGELAYRIYNADRPDAYLPAGKVFHLHGLGANAVQGFYVMAIFLQAIGLGLASEDAAASYFGRGANPGGFLKHPDEISPEHARELLRRFEERHVGTGKRLAIGILSGGLEWEPVEQTLEDSQLIATREFQVAEAARIFRVPLHLLGSTEASTYSNVSEAETAFGRHTITPWARRLEQEADYKLIPAVMRQRLCTKLRVQDIMLGDTKSTGEWVRTLFHLGALSPDDVRAMADLNPLPDGIGDVYLVPANMQRVDALDEAEGQEVPFEDGTVDPEAQQPAEDAGIAPPQQEPQDLLAPRYASEWLIRLKPCIDDIAARCAGRWVTGSRKAWKRAGGSTLRWSTWATQAVDGQVSFCVDRLWPIASVIPGVGDVRDELTTRLEAMFVTLAGAHDPQSVTDTFDVQAPDLLYAMLGELSDGE